MTTQGPLRGVAAVLGAAAVLTACGGGDEAPDDTATSSSSSSRPTAPAPLQAIDGDACDVIADSGDVYAFLSGEEAGAAATKGRLDLLTLNGVVGIYADQVETAQLGETLNTLMDEATSYAREFNGGNDAPDGGAVLEALLDAASVCDSGGRSVGWYPES